MPIELFEAYKLVSSVMFPTVVFVNSIVFFDFLSYKIKKIRWKGKFIRIFFIAENMQISSELCKIGSQYCDEVIEYDNKSFIYDSSMVQRVPKRMGKISQEPMLWYRWDNISAVNIKTGKPSYKPIDINAFKNNKLPKEFFSALNTKGITDLFKDESSITAKEVSIGLIILVVVSIGFYLLAKNMGWI